jgi:hypothetical protein
LEQEFLDVTLCCDNGFDKIQAHKVVLAAGSGLFCRLLANCSKEAMIYLKGINKEELELIISFMYNGCVDVSVTSLNSFLAAAEDLMVTGLVTVLKTKSGTNVPVSDFASVNYHNKGFPSNFSNESPLQLSCTSGQETITHSPDDIYMREGYKPKTKYENVNDGSRGSEGLIRFCKPSIAAKINKGFQAEIKEPGQIESQPSCDNDNQYNNPNTKYKLCNYKLKQEWLKIPQFNPWLRQVPEHPRKAFCSYCGKAIVAKLSSLIHHAQTKQHRICETAYYKADANTAQPASF